MSIRSKSLGDTILDTRTCKILVHSLYTEREIFLRELVSNASDALSKVQLTTLTEEKVRDKDEELQIKISF